MGTMQCHSYLPVYQSKLSHYDLNVDISDGSRPNNRGNGTFRSEHCNNYASTLPVRQANFSYKELVRETMVTHEATFKNQVQELHRLYKRQKELMIEIKCKELNVNQLQLEVQSSNSSSAILSSSCQDNLHSLPFLSKCKKIGGKLLDLELPGEVYIDRDEWESLKDAQYAERPASTVNTQLGPILKRQVASPCQGQWINNKPPTVIFSGKSLPEMGEPPEISEINDGSLRDANILTSLSSINESMSEVHISSSETKPSCSLEKRLLVVQALPSIVSHSHAGKHPKLHHKSKGFANKKLDDGCQFSPSSDVQTSLQSSSPESKLELLACMSSLTLNDMQRVNGSIDLNSAGFKISSDGGTMRKGKRCRVIDINLPCDSASDDEPFPDGVLSSQINLNSCMMNDRSPTKSSCFDRYSPGIDLEAPSSPQVEECPPPRGRSEEGNDTLEKHAQFAAEAIVSMSCKSKTLLFCKAKDYGLEQLAELIDSLSTELDNDTGNPSLNGVDDFEAMTLKLTEIKLEEYHSRNSFEIPNQKRKGRTRRSKKKDFQREVLPAIASLSRVEVTEDIQMIEGLMEAVGTPWQLRTRRACRTGRKPKGLNEPIILTYVPELKVDCVMSWGRNNRRPRGSRNAASLSVIMSRWLEFTL